MLFDFIIQALVMTESPDWIPTLIALRAHLCPITESIFVCQVWQIG